MWAPRNERRENWEDGEKGDCPVGSREVDIQLGAGSSGVRMDDNSRASMTVRVWGPWDCAHSC